MRILVTGAGGFVGQYLIPLLLSHGHQVMTMGIDNGTFLSTLNISIYDVNILDMVSVKKCMVAVHPDAVIHLAAVSNVGLAWQNPGLTIDVNIHGTVNVLQALATTNPNGLFLNIGSSDEYGLTAKSGVPLIESMPCQPQNPYAISKYCAEQMVLQLGKKYGLKVIHTRSFNHFGPGQAKGFVTSDFASQIVAIETGKQAPLLHVGDLSASRDFTFVTDVVAAYAALIEQDVPAGVYNVCSGTARKMQNILDLLISLAKVKISAVQDPNKMRPSEVPFFVGNSSKLKAVTNWQPQYKFEQGIESVLEYWRQKG